MRADSDTDQRVRAAIVHKPLLFEVDDALDESRAGNVLTRPLERQLWFKDRLVNAGQQYCGIRAGKRFSSGICFRGQTSVAVGLRVLSVVDNDDSSRRQDRGRAYLGEFTA